MMHVVHAGRSAVRRSDVVDWRCVSPILASRSARGECAVFEISLLRPSEDCNARLFVIEKAGDIPSVGS